MIKPEVMTAINQELIYQQQKWGDDKSQSLPGFIMILEAELNEAKLAWMKNHTATRQTALEEIAQVAAVAIACLNKYGVVGCPDSLDDCHF